MELTKLTEPGIHYMKITDIKDYDEEDINTPKIVIKFITNDNRIHTEKFSMKKSDNTEFGIPMITSLKKIKHICMNLVDEKIALAINNTDKLKLNLINKSAYFKLCGKEYLDKKGNIKMYLYFSLRRFCAKYNKAKRPLIFDKSKDVISLHENTLNSQKTTNDELPF